MKFGPKFVFFLLSVRRWWVLLHSLHRSHSDLPKGEVNPI